jgi:sterol desaturase/sphingolipid hydroxylase (fatty acid hydroxylase superfamily)
VLHRAHHALVGSMNYANLAPYLDVFFGTHHRPADDDYPLGSDGKPATGFWQQMLTR